ncbi:hypothetical protein ACIO1D_45440, partial [Streptomyces antimycoticus]|uniref:hypothetical protein n=1 Tax=Streptomyces antimycoticus TaxID=68175 RepID=UPI00382ABAED
RFRVQVSQATQKPPSKFLPIESGIRRSASRRTPVEQASVETFQRQTSPAAFTDDPQKGFGALHFAYLDIVKIC